MSNKGLEVHSLTEASLYLMLARCPACAGVVVPTAAGGPPDQKHLAVPVVCQACGREGEVRFDLGLVEPAEAAGGLEAWAALAQAGQAPPVNPSGRASRVIDVAGWLTLHTMLTATARAKMEQADSPAERVAARQMLIQAGECLEEALRFYDTDNELPPEDAFFSEEARRRFHEHPELFLRQRIAGLRAECVLQR